MIPSLLDTDTLSLLHKRHPQVSMNAATYMQQFGQLQFSEFSYYEVTRGLKPINASAKLAAFEHFSQSHSILPFTHAASVLAADIWANLKQRGLLIGEVDVLIAAIAINEGLAVATHNTSHFGRIANLQIVDWAI
ncbi:MAG: PIN domain-containing protein [Blastocatellia bacterium]